MSSLSKVGLTVYPNGIAAPTVDSSAEFKVADYTVVISADSGKSFVSQLDGIIYTLPPIAIGNTVTFYNAAPNGSAALNISPDASDGITYDGSSTDGRDLINTKATAKKGDFVTLASLDGVIAWQVVASRGIWAKQP